MEIFLCSPTGKGLNQKADGTGSALTVGGTWQVAAGGPVPVILTSTLFVRDRLEPPLVRPRLPRLHYQLVQMDGLMSIVNQVVIQNEIELLNITCDSIFYSSFEIRKIWNEK